MKRNSLLAVLTVSLFIVSLALLNACGKQEQPVEQTPEMPAAEAPAPEAVTTEDVKEQTKEALEAAKTYTIQQKEEYQKKIASKLDELKSEIAALEAKAKETEPELKAKLDAQIAELSQKQEAAQKKLDELEKSGEDAWAVLKADLDKAIEDLEKFIKGLIPETK